MSINEDVGRIIDDLERRFSRSCIIRELVLRLYVREVFSDRTDVSDFHAELVEGCKKMAPIVRNQSRLKRLFRTLDRLEAGEGSGRSRKPSPKTRTRS